MRFISVLLLLLIPGMTYAIGDIPSKLVPCDGALGNVCDACDLVELGQNILNWLIGITVFLVGIALAVGGLMLVMSAGDQGKRTRAKEIFTNAIVGLIILLASWLIVDTLLKVFLPDDGVLKGFGPWNQIQCSAPLPPVSAVTPTAPGGVTPTTPTPTPTPTTGGLTHAAAVAQLSGVPVVSSGSCTDRNNPSCTSLDGIQPSTLDVVKQISQVCADCNLRVTAGTEVGHTNACHQSGTCVDINCAGGCNIEQINILQASGSGNTRVVYEVRTQADKNALIQQGALPGNIEVVSWITAPHASVYTQ
jgi:hypothetical protein